MGFATDFLIISGFGFWFPGFGGLARVSNDIGICVCVFYFLCF